MRSFNNIGIPISNIDNEKFTYYRAKTFDIRRKKIAIVIYLTEFTQGIIDKYGKQRIKIEYDSISYFKNGFAKIELDKKFGLIDRDFKTLDLSSSFSFFRKICEA